MSKSVYQDLETAMSQVTVKKAALDAATAAVHTASTAYEDAVSHAEELHKAMQAEMAGVIPGGFRTAAARIRSA